MFACVTTFREFQPSPISTKKENPEESSPALKMLQSVEEYNAMLYEEKSNGCQGLTTLAKGVIGVFETISDFLYATPDDESSVKIFNTSREPRSVRMEERLESRNEEECILPERSKKKGGRGRQSRQPPRQTKHVSSKREIPQRNPEFTRKSLPKDTKAKKNQTKRHDAKNIRHLSPGDDEARDLSYPLFSPSQKRKYLESQVVNNLSRRRRWHEENKCLLQPDLKELEFKFGRKTEAKLQSKLSAAINKSPRQHLNDTGRPNEKQCLLNQLYQRDLSRSQRQHASGIGEQQPRFEEPASKMKTTRNNLFLSNNQEISHSLLAQGQSDRKKRDGRRLADHTSSRSRLSQIRLLHDNGNALLSAKPKVLALKVARKLQKKCRSDAAAAEKLSSLRRSNDHRMKSEEKGTYVTPSPTEPALPDDRYHDSEKRTRRKRIYREKHSKAFGYSKLTSIQNEENVLKDFDFKTRLGSRSQNLQSKVSKRTCLADLESMENLRDDFSENAVCNVPTSRSGQRDELCEKLDVRTPPEFIIAT